MKKTKKYNTSSLPQKLTLNFEKFQNSFSKNFQKTFSNSNRVFELSINSFGKTSKNKYLLIIELGGTFLKLYLVGITKQNLKIVKYFKKPFYQKIVYTPQILNQKIADAALKFIPQKLQQKIFTGYFLLNYSQKLFYRNHNQLDGICENFGKDHASKNIVGPKIIGKLEEKLQKSGLENIKMSISNDALAGILSSNNKPLKNTVYLNLIAGTGTNLSAAFLKNQNKLFFCNSEFGNFQNPDTQNFDQELIKKTAPGYQVEKMFSGNWQHQLFKIILKNSQSQELIQLYKKLKNKNSAELEAYFKVPQQKNSPGQKIWISLNKRGAGICAVAAFSAFKTIKNSFFPNNNKPLNLKVNLTGSQFEHASLMLSTFKKTLKKLLPQTKISIKLTKDPTPAGTVKLDQILQGNMV